MIRDYDLVLDGSDNFPTRFLVNDACYSQRKTLISGAILRFDGQLSTFKPHAGGPYYRCLFPEPPPPGVIPSCQEARILGPVAAVMGVLQANEALKEILGIGKSMAGRFLFFNALCLSFHEIQLVRDPDCPLCGDSPSIRELKDYQQTCPVQANSCIPPMSFP
jgi:molybdopterin/thiamine biosynthesis adenylyltransferase